MRMDNENLKLQELVMRLQAQMARYKEKNDTLKKIVLD